MLDHDLTFAMTVFAAIAALVVYITQRAKRTIKPKGKPLNIQKMPGAPAEATHQGSALEEWNFPRPIEVLPDPNDSVELESMPQTMPHSVVLQQESRPIRHSAQGVLIPPPSHQSQPSRAVKPFSHPRIGSRAQLRESIITMTVLGPCRALSPFEDQYDLSKRSR